MYIRSRNNSMFPKLYPPQSLPLLIEARQREKVTEVPQETRNKSKNWLTLGAANLPGSVAATLRCPRCLGEAYSRNSTQKEGPVCSWSPWGSQEGVPRSWTKFLPPPNCTTKAFVLLGWGGHRSGLHTPCPAVRGIFAG